MRAYRSFGYRVLICCCNHVELATAKQGAVGVSSIRDAGYARSFTELQTGILTSAAINFRVTGKQRWA